MARDGQVLPPVPAPGRNTLCRAVLLSVAWPELCRDQDDQVETVVLPLPSAAAQKAESAEGEKRERGGFGKASAFNNNIGF